MNLAGQFDFAILGSGFAASVLSMVLQRMGHRCVMIDRAVHPRFAIGESSTPIADQILLDLAEDFNLPILGQLARWSTATKLTGVTVGCKRGFSYFFHHAGRQQPEQRSLIVPASPDLASADSHWLRSEVDFLLATSAVDLGVQLFQGTEIQSAQRTDQGWLLTGQSDAGTMQLEADFLIDASGNAENLNRLLSLDRPLRPTATNSGCVFGHFRKPIDWDSQWKNWQFDQGQFSFPPQLAALHHVVDDGWMWHLGFDDDRISLGWVVRQNQTQLPSADQAEGWWQARLNQYPALKDLYTGAESLRELTVIPALQRWVTPAADDGWLALPSAVGFIDPLHSTGIAHAMTAVQKIARQLQVKKELDDDFLRLYSSGIEREFWLLDQMVSACYDSLDQPVKWEAATMVYFAGAIAFEEDRNRSRQSSTAIGDSGVTAPLFLMASDPQWLDRVVRATRLLKRKKAPPEGWLAAMNDVLGDYNTAGLCAPDCQGIYRYTTATK